MTTLIDLWHKRCRLFAKEVGKYGKLIFNDHFSLILLFLLGFGAYYYREQLIQLQTYTPAQLVLPLALIVGGIYWGLFQVGSPIQLMKAADQAYLFVQGHAWHPYWIRGLGLGLVWPLLLLTIITVILFPFIVIGTAWTSEQLVYFCVVPLLLKVGLEVNTYLGYYGLGIRVLPASLLKLGAALVMVAWTLFVHPWHLLVAGLCLGAWFLFVGLQWRKIGQAPIQFEMVIEQDLERANRFYKWVAIFADVPQLIPPIKRRSWLDGVLVWLSRWVKGNRFGYAYLRILMRHTAYSGIWLRVMIFVMGLIAVMNRVYLVMILGILGYLMTVVQLVPLLNYYEAHPFQQLYPVQGVQKVQAFKRVLVMIFLIQSLGYVGVAFISLHSISQWLLVLGVWTVVLLLCASVYVDYWAKKNVKA